MADTLLNMLSPSLELDDLRQRRLEEMKRNLSMRSKTFTTGATESDLRQLESDINNDPNTGTDAHDTVRKIEQQQADEAAYNSPGATEVRAQKQRDKLAELLAVPQQQGQNALDLEAARQAGERAKQEQEQTFTRELMGGGGGSANGAINSGAPGSYKMSIGANGKPSFSPVMMPALVQRAHDQLSAAHDQTLNALAEAERLYPGINDAATSTDVNTGGSALSRFFGALTGVGAPKYGGPTDRASAGLERLNYSLGVPTPFANLAQASSFGNIEQMAGQLPGVRGLATITPLFKEHQSRWGHETPLATVQRLRHMATIMEETLHGIEGGAGSEQQ